MSSNPQINQLIRQYGSRLEENKIEERPVAPFSPEDLQQLEKSDRVKLLTLLSLSSGNHLTTEEEAIQASSFWENNTVLAKKLNFFSGYRGYLDSTQHFNKAVIKEQAVKLQAKRKDILLESSDLSAHLPEANFTLRAKTYLSNFHTLTSSLTSSTKRSTGFLSERRRLKMIGDETGSTLSRDPEDTEVSRIQELDFNPQEEQPEESQDPRQEQSLTSPKNDNQLLDDMFKQSEVPVDSSAIQQALSNMTRGSSQHMQRNSSELECINFGAQILPTSQLEDWEYNPSSMDDLSFGDRELIHPPLEDKKQVVHKPSVESSITVAEVCLELNEAEIDLREVAKRFREISKEDQKILQVGSTLGLALRIGRLETDVSVVKEEISEIKHGMSEILQALKSLSSQNLATEIRTPILATVYATDKKVNSLISKVELLSEKIANTEPQSAFLCKPMVYTEPKRGEQSPDIALEMGEQPTIPQVPIGGVTKGKKKSKYERASAKLFSTQHTPTEPLPPTRPMNTAIPDFTSNSAGTSGRSSPSIPRTLNLANLPSVKAVSIQEPSSVSPRDYPSVRAAHRSGININYYLNHPEGITSIGKRVFQNLLDNMNLAKSKGKDLTEFLNSTDAQWKVIQRHSAEAGRVASEVYSCGSLDQAILFVTAALDLCN